MILVCQGLLAVDVAGRDGPVSGPQTGQLAGPDGPLAHLARLVAVNMTGLCWVGYLLVLDGVLVALARRSGDLVACSTRVRPHRFLVACLTSIPIWCYFDWVNFYFMHAWTYHGLPRHWWQRWPGYFVAFGAIGPGMFLTAQLLQQLGAKRLVRPRCALPINRVVQVVICLLGVPMTLLPLVAGNPIGNLTLWVSCLFLLDPINDWLGAASIVGDLRAGRFGRMVSLMAGGAICGLLWEFWNYWALAKWTYDLPFLGRWEAYRYFEMPWIGFPGFLPFALECWVMFNTVLVLLERAGLPVAERLPDEASIL